MRLSLDPSTPDAAALQRALSGLAVGLVVFAALGLWLWRAALADAAASGSAERAVIEAAALSDLVQGGLDRDAAPEALSTAAEAFLAAAGRQGDRFRVVSAPEKRLLAASNEPGARPLAPDEKALFDAAKALESNRRTNAAEGRDRRPLILSSVGSGTAGAAGPLRKGEAIIGLVAIERPAVEGLRGGGRWGFLGLAVLVAIAAGFAILRSSAKRAAWIALGAVLIVVVAAPMLASAGVRAALDAERFETGAFLDKAAAAARQAADVSGWTLRARAPGDYDVDRFGSPRGRFIAGEPSQTEAAPNASRRIDALGRTLLAAGVLGLGAAAFFGFGLAGRVWRTAVAHRTAYLYLAPAFVGMIALAIMPFLYGVALSFTDTTLLNQSEPFFSRWVGLANYAGVLADGDFVRVTDGRAAINYENFYWTLGMTIAWTVSNVVIGVSVGLALAMLLNIPGFKGVAVYRMLLILPWAVPNYITALTWKGMFHPEFGVINQMVALMGGAPIRWFDGVFTSFLTGLATNGWLSFPFMMVVCLGALQAVDRDMYEAARIDGASAWQRFRHITVPALAPALVPAIVVSVIWTFNMFNVIYLVSAGEPGGATEILVTKAYREAFEKYRYGYAAAYSVVIFAILLTYGLFQTRVTRAMEAR